MADAKQRLPTNVPGDFFVDETCIDCDTCRWMSPELFDRANTQSRVHRQPEHAEEIRRANMALLSCPTGSIGSASSTGMPEAVASFPDPIDGPVHHCGFHSEKSFGAASYLIVRPEGNILIDSPRFAAPLADRIEKLGGVKYLFLTHRDDVADHRKFRDRFGCERILHVRDVTTDTAQVERQIDGEEAIHLDEATQIIPTPGHTEGSACLLYRDEYLFTGDHLAWKGSPDRGEVYGFRSACWYDWNELGRSTRKLGEYRFSWILPGHGKRVRLAPELMAKAVARCADRILSG